MENRFINSLVECSNKQKGRIKQIIHNARQEIEKCSDIYQPGKCRKYQLEISNKAMQLIQSIQQEYLEDCAKMLQKHELELRVADDNRAEMNNVDKLLYEINKLNKIQMTQIKCQCMSIDELFNYAHNQNDEVVMDIVKASIYNNANATSQDKLNARALNVVTEWDLLKQANQMFLEEQMNIQSILPGMELSEELIINKAGGLRAFIEMDVEPISNEELNR